MGSWIEKRGRDTRDCTGSSAPRCGDDLLRKRDYRRGCGGGAGSAGTVNTNLIGNLIFNEQYVDNLFKIIHK